MWHCWLNFPHNAEQLLCHRLRQQAYRLQDRSQLHVLLQFCSRIKPLNDIKLLGQDKKTQVPSVKLSTVSNKSNLLPILFDPLPVHENHHQ